MNAWIPAVVLLVACTGGKTPPDAAAEESAPAATDPTPETPETPELTPGPVPGVEHTEPADPDAPAPASDSPFGDSYWLVGEPAPTVENNIFRAVARHGGGCAAHEFTYVSTGIGRSKPPTALGVLHHNGNGDRCRALLVTPIEIDLNEVLKDRGCIGKVSIGTPEAQDEAAAGGALIFAIDPIGCEE